MFWLLFAIFLGACTAAGAMGALFPPGEWYDELEKPSWTPPNWLFPLAWTTLYLLMSWAGARVGALPGNGVALALWSLQIAVNALWTPVFFGMRKLKAGMLVLVGLWLAVAACTVAMFAVDAFAGLMFVPYVVWVTVAGALNLAVIRLNPEVAKNG